MTTLPFRRREPFVLGVYRPPVREPRVIDLREYRRERDRKVSQPRPATANPEPPRVA